MEALIVFGVIFLIFVVIALVSLVASIITLWKLFTKAGQPGIAALVPVYNVMVMAKIGGRSTWVGFITGILSVLFYVMSNSNNFFVKETDPAMYLGYFGITYLLSAIFLGLYIYIIIGCMRKYDKGVMIWLLFVLLPIVAVFLVGKVKYIGDSETGDSNMPYAGQIAQPTNNLEQTAEPQPDTLNTPQAPIVEPSPIESNITQPTDPAFTPSQEAKPEQPEQPKTQQN